jgi:hypothetical protein
MVGGDEIAQVHESFGDDIEDRPVGGQDDVLYQPGHAQAGLVPHGAAIGRLAPGPMI